jgi:hypothetical protein
MLAGPRSVKERARLWLAHPRDLGYDCRMKRLAALAMTTALMLLSAGPGAAQEPFHITFQRGRDEPSSLVLVGNVTNRGSRDVVDVWVTAEALNAEGRVVGQGIAFVGSELRAGRSTPFTVKLPPAEQAKSFRVAVSSFRYLIGAQSP